MLYPLSYEGLPCILPGQGVAASLLTSTTEPAVPHACHNEAARGVTGGQSWHERRLIAGSPAQLTARAPSPSLHQTQGEWAWAPTGRGELRSVAASRSRSRQKRLVVAAGTTRRAARSARRRDHRWYASSSVHTSA